MSGPRLDMPPEQWRALSKRLGSYDNWPAFPAMAAIFSSAS